MTGALDARMRRTADSLMSRLGKAMTFTKVTGGTYDPTTQKTTGGTSTPYAVNGYPNAASARYLGEKYGQGLILGGEIEVTLPAASLPITPAEGDLVTVDGVQRRVITVRPTYSGELVAVWDLLVRRG